MQAVRDSASAVGCGFAKCDGSSRLYCNYAHANKVNPPYDEGETCGQCPDSCNGGLCGKKNELKGRSLKKRY